MWGVRIEVWGERLGELGGRIRRGSREIRVCKHLTLNPKP